MLLSLLEELTDIRSYHGKEYKLHHILYFSVLAILSNAKSYTEVATFIRVNFAFLKEHFGLKWRHAPDPSAICKIIVGVDATELEAIFQKDAERLEAPSQAFKQICFDGKTLCGSFSHTKDKRAVSVFSAFAAHNQLVLAHLPLETTKDHEIPALQKFLLNLNLKDIVVTADALHCQKKFECAELANAILLTQVKENQKVLLKQLKHGCHIQRPLSFHDGGGEKAHGRLERRQYEVFSSRPMLDKWQNEWGSIAQVIRVTRFRQRLNSTQQETKEVHYYVANRSLSAELSSQAIRRHWYIENKLHYVKDVAFQEDVQTKRVNPFIFSTCIDLALNRLRKSECKNIKNKIYEFSLNIKNLLHDTIVTSDISTP